MPYIYGIKGLPVKHQAVKDYLYRWWCEELGNTVVPIEKVLDKQLQLAEGKQFPIWVCWMQGESKMPEVVKLCYNSLRKNSQNSLGDVILLTADNIEDYIAVPDFIRRKMKSNELMMAHFADWLRISLLADYGGLWIDATVYVSRPIDFYPQTNQIYTIKAESKSNTFVSQCRWAINVLGCKKNGCISLIRDIFQEYIATHKSFIDYFLLDYVFATLYDHNSQYRLIIDNLNNNNIDYYALSEHANDSYTPEAFERLMSNQTYHKLNWKNVYLKVNDGSPTIYAYLIDSK